MMSRQLLSVIQITHIFFMHRGMNRIMLLFKGRCWRRFYLCNLFLAFCFFFQGVNAEDTDTVTVHFQKNEFTIDELYRDNSSSMQHIDSILRTATINRIIINSSTSPDGKALYNKELSVKRSRALRDLIVSRCPGIESRIVEKSAYNQTWNDILPEIETHSLYLHDYQSTLLILCDEQKDDFAKQQKLKTGIYSDNYVYIAEKILPQSRYAECIFYIAPPMHEESKDEILVYDVDTLKENTIDIVEPVPVKSLKSYRWNITTNLMHWAVLAHNVGVEYEMNRKNTIGISGSCAWFSNKSRHRVYRWMVGELAYHHYFRKYDVPKGAFIGAFAQIGEFEMMFSPRNRKGEFYSGGVCGGYRWHLKKEWFMEAEAGVGYMHIDYRHALDINGVLIRQGKDNCNYLLPSRISLSLIYRLGNK